MFGKIDYENIKINFSKVKRMNVLLETVAAMIPPIVPSNPHGTMWIEEDSPDFDCPVCWNTITEGEKKVRTSCDHLLCSDCVLKMQCIPGIEHCVSCPMCRSGLNIGSVEDGVLRRIPLNKIRSRLEQQNRIIAGYHYQIHQSPNIIAYYMQRIQGEMFQEEKARRELGPALERQARLQAEVDKRARPRARVSTSAVV